MTTPPGPPAPPAPFAPFQRTALVTAPALTLAAHLVQVSPADHGTGSELASIAAHPVSYQVAAFLGFLSAVAWVPALLALAGLLRPRLPRLAAGSLAATMTGLLALVALMGSGPVSLAMARAGDRAAMVRVTEDYEGAPLTVLWVLLMILGLQVGLVVLGTGLWRAGQPVAVPLLLAAGLVVQMADAGRWPLALGFALTTAGTAVVALSAARPRRTPAETPPAPRGAGGRAARSAPPTGRSSSR